MMSIFSDSIFFFKSAQDFFKKVFIRSKIYMANYIWFILNILKQYTFKINGTMLIFPPHLVIFDVTPKQIDFSILFAGVILLNSLIHVVKRRLTIAYLFDFMPYSILNYILKNYIYIYIYIYNLFNHLFRSIYAR